MTARKLYWIPVCSERHEVHTCADLFSHFQNKKYIFLTNVWQNKNMLHTVVDNVNQVLTSCPYYIYSIVLLHEICSKHERISCLDVDLILPFVTYNSTTCFRLFNTPVFNTLLFQD